MTKAAIHPLAFNVPQSKLVDYLLDPGHRTGASKAKFFSSFGFRREDPQRLAEALLEHARIEHFAREELTPLGRRKLIFEGMIVAPDGRTPTIRTVWQVRLTEEADFVTAVPITKGRRR